MARFEYVLQNLTVVVSGEREFMCACPYCEGGSSLQFNAEKGLWLCFKCDEKGNVKKLLEKLGLKFREEVMDIVELGRSIDEAVQATPLGIQTPQRRYTDRYLLRFRNIIGMEYWDSRGIPRTVQQRYSLGYDPITKRYTIPFRHPHTKEIEGIIFRESRTDIFPRYQYPKGFRRMENLFGSWELGAREIDTAIVVEGAVDSIKLFSALKGGSWNVSRKGDVGEPHRQFNPTSWKRTYFPVAQYGSSISNKQIRLLLRFGIREVIFFTDADRAGIKAANTGIRNALSQGLLARAVEWDKDKYCFERKEECSCNRIHGADPGNLNHEESVKMIEDIL